MGRSSRIESPPTADAPRQGPSLSWRIRVENRHTRAALVSRTPRVIAPARLSFILMRYPSFITDINIFLLGASLSACAPVDSTDTTLDSESSDTTTSTNSTTANPGDPSSDHGLHPFGLADRTEHQRARMQADANAKIVRLAGDVR
jgi:hypothetical protein